MNTMMKKIMKSVTNNNKYNENYYNSAAIKFQYIFACLIFTEYMNYELNNFKFHSWLYKCKELVILVLIIKENMENSVILLLH